MKTNRLIITNVSPVIMNLGVFSIFCIGLIAIRYYSTHNITYFFLVWNLFLAWVPLLLAILWRHRLIQGHLAYWKSVIMYGLWLLFFPNAPYIITDLVHLNNRFHPGMWSDMLMLFTCALSGLIVGLYSLKLIHDILDSFLSKGVAWAIVFSSLLLTGYGIYLGRVQRWNSWDLFTNPTALVVDTVDQLSNPAAIQMTIGFSLFLAIIYITILSLSHHGSIKK